MASINRYIFRTTMSAFLIVAISLTALIWVTQALRDIDLMTSQGQTVFIFVAITGMIIPLLLLILAPVALFIAVAHTLNKLSGDSEIIVLNAAGLSPWQLFRAFISSTIVVSLFVAVLSAYFAPKGLRVLRDWITEVRANLVSNIVQPGRFVGVQSGVTFHIRARNSSGQLQGVFMDDRRNPAERVTILAETGDLLENKTGTFLVLRTGTIQRYESTKQQPSNVAFDRYALDLSRFAGGPQQVRYSIREQYIWELLFPSANDQWFIEQPDRFRAELHDRLLAPIYPIAFVIITFAYLGMPRTNRQSRTMSLLGAMGGVALLRLVGFMVSGFGANIPILVSAQYVVVGATMAAGLYVIRRGIIIEPPAAMTEAITSLTARLTRRFAPS